MTAEVGIFTLLATDAGLLEASELPADEFAGCIYRSGAANDPPDFFMVIRWESDVLRGHTGMHQFTFRVHDRDNTYSRIDACLEAAKARLTSVVHQQGITQIDWRGRSPDLADDGYRTLTRFDTYVVAAGMTTRTE